MFPSVVLDFERLRRELDECLAEVLEVARSAASTTGAPWRVIVEAMTGRPPGGLPPAGAGANPAEVGSVLAAVQGLYDRRLQLVERALDQHEIADGLEDAIWTFRHRRLDGLVRDELAAYIKSVNPRPSIGAVFARAANQVRSTPALVPTPVARVQLHRCTTCGAPRLGARLYGNCLYCGHPFFTGHEEVS